MARHDRSHAYKHLGLTEDTPNLYSVLGVNAFVTPEFIRRGGMRKMQAETDPEMKALIGLATTVLGNPETKDLYDSILSDKKISEQAAAQAEQLAARQRAESQEGKSLLEIRGARTGLGLAATLAAGAMVAHSSSRIHKKHDQGDKPSIGDRILQGTASLATIAALLYTINQGMKGRSAGRSI